jgi:L-malate glycosyltransferase
VPLTELTGPQVAVQQFVPFLHARDAVGNHALATHEALAAAGLRPALWVAQVEPNLAARTRPYKRYGRSRGRLRPRTRDVLLYQSSTGASEMVSSLVGLPQPLLMYYHNVTPASFFDAYDAGAAQSMREARIDLARLTGRVRLALTASRFSAAELHEIGVSDVRVVPPYVASGASAATADPQYLRTLRRTRRHLDLLFVSRVVPHKGHLHLLRMLAALRGGGIDARLFIVGARGPQAYMDTIMRLRRRLGLEESAILTGSISEAELAAHYESADVFTSLSEHEGFAIPLLEAMRAGTPILAYDAGAVSETLDGAGILVRTLDPYMLAEVVSRVLCDQQLREELRERQLQRALELDRTPRDVVLLEAVRAAAEE